MSRPASRSGVAEGSTAAADVGDGCAVAGTAVAVDKGALEATARSVAAGTEVTVDAAAVGNEAGVVPPDGTAGSASADATTMPTTSSAKAMPQAAPAGFSMRIYLGHDPLTEVLFLKGHKGIDCLDWKENS